MTGTPEDVSDDIAPLPEDRRPIVERVHRLVRESAPELEPAMWKGMIGYGSYRAGGELVWAAADAMAGERPAGG